MFRRNSSECTIWGMIWVFFPPPRVELASCLSFTSSTCMTSHLAEELNSLDDHTKSLCLILNPLQRITFCRHIRYDLGKLCFVLFFRPGYLLPHHTPALFSQPSMHRRNRKSFFILPGIGNRGSALR